MKFSRLEGLSSKWARAAMIRPLVMLTGLVLLTGFTTARAETFGRTTAGATPSGALRADYKRGSKFTLPQAGTATGLCALLDGGGAATGEQSFRLVLYRDVNGAPGAKVAQTSDSLIYAGQQATWRCLDTGWTPLTAGAYWLVIHTGGPASAGPLRYFYDGAANYVTNQDGFLDSAADPAGPVGSGNGTISIYATYHPGTNLTHVGKMTIGATPSGGLRGDFKRGSSITFPQSGKVTALSAYLDGKGASSPNSQRVRFALYEDVNGVPAKLVAQTQDRYIAGDSPGRWYTLPVPDGVVHAGKYWLMLHTGTTGAIARYMADGTGNWFGNADAFDDDSSAQFGTAGAGNGTISAYASYLPGSALPNTFGNTYVGTSIDTSFADAFIDGSRFRLTSSGATINGLYAYLDGLAGSTGTEQVRMAVFSDGGGWASDIVAVSSVVSINAGRQPGWVKFDVTPTALPPGLYWVSVHIGPTPGVVRKYYDGGGRSLYNYEDNFADGPSGFVNSDGELQGGNSNLSVYATYTTN